MRSCGTAPSRDTASPMPNSAAMRRRSAALRSASAPAIAQLVRDGVASAQRREGLEQAGVVLVAIEGGDGQQVGAGGTPRRGRLFKRGGDVRGQAVGNDAEAGWIETQQADGFAGGGR